MPDQPLITVVTPLYNYAHYIGEAIESVLAQTHANFEMLIVDDGSSDNGPEVVESYKDPRVRLIRQARNGCGVARAVSRAISESKGEYISWLSADDYYLPNKLERNLEAMIEGRARDPMLAMIHSQPGIESSDRAYIATHCPLPADEVERQLAAQGKVRWKFPAAPAADPDMLLHMLMCNQINGCTTLIRKDAFARTGLLRNSWSVAQDYEMWLRLLLAGYSVRYLPDVLTIVRFHEVNKGLYNDIIPAEANLVSRFGMELVSPQMLADSLQRRGLAPDQLWLWRADLFARQHIFDYALVYLEVLQAQGAVPEALQGLLPQLNQMLALPEAELAQPLDPNKPGPRSYLISLSDQGIRPWRLIAVLTGYFEAFEAGTPVELRLWLDPGAGEDLEAACEAKIDGILAYLGRSRASLPAYAYLRETPLATACDAADVYLPIGNPDLLEQQATYRFRSQGKLIQYLADGEDFRRARVYDAGLRHWRLSRAHPYLWMWPDSLLPLTSHPVRGGEAVYYQNHWFSLSGFGNDGRAEISYWQPGNGSDGDEISVAVSWDPFNASAPGAICHPAWSPALAAPVLPLDLDEANGTVLLAFYDPEQATGWRETLAAFLAAAAPDTVLLIYADASRFDDEAVFDALTSALAALGQDPEQVENLVLLCESFDETQLAALFRAATAIVAFWPLPQLARLWPALASSGATLLMPPLSDRLSPEHAVPLASPAELGPALGQLLAEPAGLRRGLGLKAVYEAQYRYRDREDWLRQLLDKAWQAGP